MRTVWSYGFRPFFFSGAIISVLLILYWAVVFYNEALVVGYFDPINWHAHEMIFGFVTCIVAGFLLTATANWTQGPPVSGNRLKLIFLFWLAGRVAMALSLSDLPVPHWVYFLVDALFIPSLVEALSHNLIRARQLRNLQFLPVLTLLMIANVLTHLASLEVIDYDFASRGIYMGVNLILLIMVIIGGRIIPAFTANAVPGLRVNRRMWVEKACYLSVWAYIVLDFTQYHLITGWFALPAGLLNLMRLSGWGGLKTLKNPLLWVLHLGYLWICFGFLLIFSSDVLGVLPRSVAIHAFTAGAMGTFILGMMSRVSLAHTGRPLKLPNKFVLAYLLVSFSGIVRVGSGFFPDYYRHGILCAGLLWVSAFVLFFIFYAKMLLSPRADGRPG